jgi:N-acetylmuramoyl-L-alanine amidase
MIKIRLKYHIKYKLLSYLTESKILVFLTVVLLLFVFEDNILCQYKVKTVVIDAGHGGKDPGASGKKSKEKDIALSIALKLGDYIVQNIPGVKVLYTRKTDEFIELFKRADVANKNKADVFISIHVNANKSSKMIGTSTYVMGLHKSEENLEVAKLENSVILKEDGYKTNYKGYDPNSPESHIIMTLLQNSHLDHSLKLASKIQEQFRERAGRNDMGVRQAGLVVLWTATMPAILVETGFISNPTEEKYLMSDEGQSVIASAVYRAFKEYKNEIEKSGSNYKQGSSSNVSNSDSNLNSGDSDVIFRIQFKISTDKLKNGSSDLFGYTDVKEYYFKGIYKYYVGQTSDFNEILKLQIEIRKKVPDAFVVAFKNDKPISIKEAMKEIGRD